MYSSLHLHKTGAAASAFDAARWLVWSQLSLTSRLRLLCLSELKESAVSLKLTVVDTVGFGDQIDKSERYRNAHSFRFLVAESPECLI